MQIYIGRVRLSLDRRCGLNIQRKITDDQVEALVVKNIGVHPAGCHPLECPVDGCGNGHESPDSPPHLESIRVA
jgi:hypothetical protein